VSQQLYSAFTAIQKGLREHSMGWTLQLTSAAFFHMKLYYKPVRFAGLLWLKVLFAGLL
jgi:hypothetical protein